MSHAHNSVFCIYIMYTKFVQYHNNNYPPFRIIRCSFDGFFITLRSKNNGKSERDLGANFEMKN